MIDSRIMRELASAIADAGSTVVHSSEHTATVTRVDLDGTVWVTIPGGAGETPASTSLVSVSQGDTVKVLIANGRATVTGNATSPAANVTELSAVEQKADTATNAAVEAGSDAQRANETAEAAMTAAEEATAAADAIGQHFWNDTVGVHVSEVERDTWNRAVLDDFDDYDPTTKPYNNLLLNSLGILLRTAIKNLVSITRSAVAFFDGNGNAASNITASFGADGAQIGKLAENHLVIEPSKIRMETGDEAQLMQLTSDGETCEFRLGGTIPSNYSNDAVYELLQELLTGYTIEDYYDDGTLYLVSPMGVCSSYFMQYRAHDDPRFDPMYVYGRIGIVNSPNCLGIAYTDNYGFFIDYIYYPAVPDLGLPTTITAANVTLLFKKQFMTVNGGLTVNENESVNGTLDVGGRLSLGDGSTTTEAAVYAKLASRNAAAIRLIDYDVNGSAVVIGDGGLTVVGGGESASALYNALINAGDAVAGTEQLHLASDNALFLYSNCNAIASRHSATLGTDGAFTNNGIVQAKSGNITSNTTPSSATSGTGYFRFLDSAGTSLGFIVPYFLTSGNQYLRIQSQRVVSGSTKSNRLNLGVDASGNALVSVEGTGAAKAWRDAIGTCSATAIFTGKNVSNGGTIGTYTSVFDYRLFWAQLSGSDNNWCLCYRTGNTSTAGYIRGVGSLDNGTNSYVFKTNISVSTAGVLKVVASSQHLLGPSGNTGTGLYVSALYGIK